MIVGWKVLTHDLRSPIRGGTPIWGGSLPVTLTPVAVDQSEEECGAGWASCPYLESALRIAGLWPDGWQSRAFYAEAGGTIVTGVVKNRSTDMRLVREAESSEIAGAVRALSDTSFGVHAEYMAAEQMAWRVAFSRLTTHPPTITAGLAAALAARGLNWTVTKFVSPAAMDWTGSVSREARWRWAAEESHKAASVMNAEGMVARELWRVRGPWKDEWDGAGCKDAQGALMQAYALREGWLPSNTPNLTVGLRDAYAAGLRYVAPASPGVLGWVQ